MKRLEQNQYVEIVSGEGAGELGVVYMRMPAMNPVNRVRYIVCTFEGNWYHCSRAQLKARKSCCDILQEVSLKEES